LFLAGIYSNRRGRRSRHGRVRQAGQGTACIRCRGQGKQETLRRDESYRLVEDIGETNNVAAAHSDPEKEMTDLIQHIGGKGRS
jgi:hypothetical protein